MLMVSNPSRGGARAAVRNVNSNASGLERAAKRCRLLAAAASLAGHLISNFTISCLIHPGHQKKKKKKAKAKRSDFFTRILGFPIQRNAGYLFFSKIQAQSGVLCGLWLMADELG
jgi:hypothetical protein